MILWIDFETTDLDKRDCELLEVAVVLTDDRMASGALATVYWSLMRPMSTATWKSRMGDYVRDMHTANGLIDEIDQSGPALPTVERVEMEIIEFIDQWLPVIGGRGVGGGLVPVAGSGTSHFDIQVLEYRMPELAARLTYWSYDVGAVRRFLRDMTDLDDLGFVDPPDSSAATHRARDDVESHIGEARQYQRLLQTIVPKELRTS